MFLGARLDEDRDRGSNGILPNRRFIAVRLGWSCEEKGNSVPDVLSLSLSSLSSLSLLRWISDGQTSDIIRLVGSSALSSLSVPIDGGDGGVVNRGDERAGSGGRGRVTSGGDTRRREPSDFGRCRDRLP